MRLVACPQFYPPAHEKAQRHGLRGFVAGAEESGKGGGLPQDGTCGLLASRRFGSGGSEVAGRLHACFQASQAIQSKGLAITVAANIDRTEWIGVVQNSDAN